jgi:hypothetical protein
MDRVARQRTARPTQDLSGRPGPRGANIAMVVMAAARVGMFFILTLYQQQVEGYSALTSG